uniref:TFIIB-type zinc ribbon-containing protein n=1 Tax=Yoonia sp. TaxID=2212373 RepID=UPI004047A77D
MLCPVCNVALTMSERQGVEIDYCPQCRGVWLDRGELDKIIERNESAAVAPPREPEPRDRDYDDDDDDYRSRGGHGGGHRKHGGHSKHGGYRRKSWLHELFD